MCTNRAHLPTCAHVVIRSLRSLILMCFECAFGGATVFQELKLVAQRGQCSEVEFEDGILQLRMYKRTIRRIRTATFGAKTAILSAAVCLRCVIRKLSVSVTRIFIHETSELF